MTPEPARSLRDDAGSHFRTTSDPSARSTPAAPPVINRTDALRCRIADLARKTKHGACQQPSASFVVATGRHGAVFRRFAVGMDDEVQYRRGASSISPLTASPCRFAALSRLTAGDPALTRTTACDARATWRQSLLPDGSNAPNWRTRHIGEFTRMADRPNFLGLYGEFNDALSAPCH